MQDWLMVDAAVVPLEHVGHYSEKLVYLPHSYQCNNFEGRQRPTWSKGQVAVEPHSHIAAVASEPESSPDAPAAAFLYHKHQQQQQQRGQHHQHQH